MLLDPMLSLCYSVQSNKGVYALLLGSGISRSAGIPTGWEITLDLVKRIATLNGKDIANPEQWYKINFGKEPEYSEVLHQVAETPSERNQILKHYFEPTTNDDSLNKKPTKAHQAIARLIQEGYIKVVITTNFDRLLESALSDIGVVPNVISNADQIDGAMPLIHSKCTIIKVNGDYMDTRIKNTTSELSTYDDKMKVLLSRVFDEFGFIICGWSGEWDVALKECIFSCKNRRFTYYWLSKDILSQEAKRIVDFKGAKVIEISDADSFFDDFKNKIESLEELNQKEIPLSIDVACATLKRLLPNNQNRIRISDMILNECKKVSNKILHIKTVENVEGLKNSIKQFEDIMELLLNLITVGCYWEGNQYRKIWCQTYKQLYSVAESKIQNGLSNAYTDIYKYPALMAQYIITMVCIYGEQYDLLFAILCQTKTHERGYENIPSSERLISQNLYSGRVISRSLGNAVINDGKDYFYPLSNALYSSLKKLIVQIVPENEYRQLFDKAELFFSLNFWFIKSKNQSHGWAPTGEFACAWDKYKYMKSLFQTEFEVGDSWKALKSGFWNGEFSNFETCFDEHSKFIEGLQLL